MMHLKFLGKNSKNLKKIFMTSSLWYYIPEVYGLYKLIENTNAAKSRPNLSNLKAIVNHH